MGSVSADGIFQLTEAFDSLGGMAKSADDLAALTEFLFSSVPGSPVAGRNMQLEFRESFKGLRLGFLDIDEWRLPSNVLQPVENYLQQRVCFAFILLP